MELSVSQGVLAGIKDAIKKLSERNATIRIENTKMKILFLFYSSHDKPEKETMYMKGRNIR